MKRTVREMELADVSLRINYFHGATENYLRSLGVDSDRRPDPAAWRQRYELEYRQPVQLRKEIGVVRELDSIPAGFSTADRITFGNEAFMHLHIVDAANRMAGNGSWFVRESVRHYFNVLKLKRLFCEPYAFNVTPNRTLQKVGFKYLITHETVPGPLNFCQPVNRWMIERAQVTAWGIP